MDKAWCEQKQKEYYEKIEKRKEDIIAQIKSQELLSEEDRERFVKELIKACDAKTELLNLEMDLYCAYDPDEDDLYEAYHVWVDNLKLSDLHHSIRFPISYEERYLDSEPMEFDGDIIITDPCYVMRIEDQLTENDWTACDYGFDMKVFGMKRYMTRDTLYGDWSCTTYNTDTKEKIGEFCSDAGLVSVFDLAELLAYNPNFNYHEEKLWTTTWIKDFKGTVQMQVTEERGVWENDSEYHKKGEEWTDYSVQVIGHGVNKVTGELINFYTTQTGF